MFFSDVKIERSPIDLVTLDVMQIYMQFTIYKWLSYKSLTINIINWINIYAFFGDVKIERSPILWL